MALERSLRGQLSQTSIPTSAVILTMIAVRNRGVRPDDGLP